jgi:hypothetical protein
MNSKNTPHRQIQRAMMASLYFCSSEQALSNLEKTLIEQLHGQLSDRLERYLAGYTWHWIGDSYEP